MDRDALAKFLTEQGVHEDEVLPAIGRLLDEQPSRDGMLLKSYVADEIRATKEGDIEAYVSTEAVDRVGDVIPSKAWNLSNFKKTGSPVLAFHEYGLVGGQVPVVGKAVHIERDKTGLLAVTRFHGKTQLSRDLATLYRDGDMKSFSVGFRSEAPPEVIKDEGGMFTGYKFTKVELLEYSVVAVPANPEAVAKHAGGKTISAALAAFIAGHSPTGGHYGSGGDEAARALKAIQFEAVLAHCRRK